MNNDVEKIDLLYDVNSYSETELFNDILELDDNPTDSVLESKILSMVNKYDHLPGETAERLTQFFIDIYARFFNIDADSEDDEYVKEGFVGYAEPTTSTVQPYTRGGSRTVSGVDVPTNNRLTLNDDSQTIQPSNANVVGNPNSEYTASIRKGGEYDIGNIDDPTIVKKYSNFVGDTELLDESGKVIDKYKTPQIAQNYNVNQIQNRGVLNKQEQTGGTQITKPVDYARDSLNPLLKQTIKRVISIDSQYRENKSSSSTEFTFNLSEPLKDVVSLKLYSIQIPYTWYTINGSFGGNFFYIKGDVPGIDNGDHDYKIEIPSGNYTATTLTDAIKLSISNLRTTILDVSFGTTDITYAPASVLSTLRIDMKETFGESNYYVEFPSIPTTGNIVPLTGLFGYNNTYYDACSLFSSNITFDNTVPIVIDSSNNTIYIKTYSGKQYSDAAVCDTTTILITENTYNTINELVFEINSQIKSSIEFESAHSFAEIITMDNGDNCIHLSFKLTRTFLRNIDYIKIVAIFPNDNVVWLGANSALKFPAILNELSNIVSENIVLKSKYKVSGNYQKIEFISIKNGYMNDAHNFSITVPPSPTSIHGYKLLEYISTINELFSAANSLQNTKMTFTDSSNIKLTVDISNNMYTSDYKISFNGSNASRIFNVPDGEIIYLSSRSTFHYNLQPTEIPEFGPGDNITFTPVNPKNGTPFIMPFSAGGSIVFNSIDEFVSYINETLSNYVDAEDVDYFNMNPLANSNINIDTLDLRIAVHKRLTYHDYKIAFTSDDLHVNSWNTFLGFTYNSITNNAFDCSANATNEILNTKQLVPNLFFLNNTNNYFNVKSFSDINGLTQNGVGLYDIRVNIDLSNGYYTIDEIFDKINNVFDLNPITKGTKIGTTGVELSGYTLLRLDINKAFRSPDYRLVFYDPYSFVSCYSGASHNGNKSVQNATWDTTLGWILGFRDSIIYYLNDQPNNSYSGIDNKICSLTGDTTVSTSLYNYFLIVLDDYTQNHLNDGLVTITTQETTIDVEPYTYICDPYRISGSTMVAVPISSIGLDGKTTKTQREIYTFNQKLLSKNVKAKSYSKGPFVKDIFGIIPIKTAGLTTGSTYVEFGGTLQNQERMYFGPVNIHRMTIRLLNDRGDSVDLNNSNWSFSLVCEQLYRSKV